jgi:hypothetical protein
MADPPRYPETGDDTGVGPDRGSPPSTPRWVKVFGIIVLVLVLLVVVMLLIGGGNHGPGRHTGGDGDTPPAGVTEAAGAGGHAPPAGGRTPG